MKTLYSYRNLIIWQRAQKLALAVLDLVQRVPQSWANAVLVRQIVGSATSIGANIAEGHGRYSFGAHKNHLSIAKGSAAETDSWLDLFRRSGWLSTEEEQVLHEECKAMMGLLTIKMRSLERSEREVAKRMREEPAGYGDDLEEAPSFPFTIEDYVSDDSLS